MKKVVKDRGFHISHKLSTPDLVLTNKIELLTLSEIGAKIKLNDPKSIKNWVRQNGITIHKLASRTFVYDLDLKVCLLKPLVLELMRKYPKRWREICRNIINEDVVFDMLLIELDEGPMIFPKYKMQFNSVEEEKLYNDLVA
jgi:hypothetical protein